MKVLCIGDSLGLPREGCPYETTWFYRLKETFTEHEFIDYFIRGLLIIDALHRYTTYFQYYKADVAIIQTGICDCSPRFINDKKTLPKLLIKISQRIGVEAFFWKIVKMGERKANCVYTQYDTFLNIYSQLVNKLICSGVKKIIFVKIGHATDRVLTKNPFFNSNVDKYNIAIEQICEKYPNETTMIDPLHDIGEEDFVDGYHCNPRGMEKVYMALKAKIATYGSTE